MVYDKEAFENTKQGQYVKEHTTKGAYFLGYSADDKGKLSFPVKDKTYKQVHVPTGLKRYFKTKRKNAASEDDDALLAGDEGITEDPVLWGDDALAATDKQEEDQAQEDEGQRKPRHPKNPGGKKVKSLFRTLSRKTTGRSEDFTSIACTRKCAPKLLLPPSATMHRQYLCSTWKSIEQQYLTRSSH